MRKLLHLGRITHQLCHLLSMCIIAIQYGVIKRRIKLTEHRLLTGVIVRTGEIFNQIGFHFFPTADMGAGIF